MIDLRIPKICGSLSGIPMEDLSILYFFQSFEMQEFQSVEDWSQSFLQLLHVIPKLLQTVSKPNVQFCMKDCPFPPKLVLFKETSEAIRSVQQGIIQTVRRYQQKPDFHSLSAGQKILIEELGGHLKELNKDINYLLDEGIIIIYLDILESIEAAVAKSISSLLQSFAKEIIIGLSPVLKKFFVYKEYSKESKRIQSLRQQETIFSDSNKENLSSKDQSDDILHQAEIKLSHITGEQLLKDYLQNQITQIGQKQEKCKICSKKFKLESLEVHAKLCQKMNALRQKYIQIKIREEKLKGQISQQLQHLDTVQKTEVNESLKRVLLAFLKGQNACAQKIKNRRRSVSIAPFESQIDLKEEREKYFFDHISRFSNHEVISQLIDLQNEKMGVRKHLQSVGTLLNHVQGANPQSLKTEKSLDILNVSNKSMKFTDCSKESQKSISDPYTCFTNTQFDCIASDSEQSDTSEQIKHVKKVTSAENMEGSFNQSQQIKKVRFQQDSQQYLASSTSSISLQSINFQEETEISLNSFQILKTLGKGAYGKVYLVRRKQTEDLYALKIIKPPQNCSEKDLENIATEHQIFKKIAGDHLVKAPFSFSEKGSHIFVMQLMPGGDLRALLTEQVYLEEEKAKFYLAEIVLAIEHLHNFDIIHRDLKPENIVFDQQGHLKLTDFGLSAMSIQKRLKKSRQINKKQGSKKNLKRREGVSLSNSKTINLIGTPDYIAPEIINRISTNNKSIDWWSLGVMTYELLIGNRPFCGDTIEEVIDNIQGFKIDWPEIGTEEGISAEAKDLIEQLLNKDFVSRLGAEDIDDIKSHPFFHGIQWDKIKHQIPPFVPDLSKILQAAQASENPSLRQQLEDRLGSECKTFKSFKLDKFVRYDILGKQTISTVSKLLGEKKNRLRKMKSCLSFDKPAESLDLSEATSLDYEATQI